jgi:hypothetical protein
LGEGDACRPEVGKAGCGVSELKRLILDYRGGELIARVLYRSSLDGPNPAAKARTREDVLLATTSPAALQTASKFKITDHT